MKKSFISLLIGFGATLAIFVAVTMPPGSWAVIIGVLLGLMACIPVLLVMVAFLSRGNKQEAPPPQPIIVMQPPMPQGYAMPYNEGGYLPQYDAYGYPYQLEPQRGKKRRPDPREQQRPLPSRRREQFDSYQGYYDQGYYYDAPPAQPEQYDNYYGVPQPQYAQEYYPPVQPRGKKNNRRHNELAEDGEYRAIGD
jgi:hypothetical protein